MSRIRFGCQFYTWQMSGDRYVGRLPDILGVVGRAGFAGIETETCMLGSYYQDPLRLREVLERHGLELGAIAFVCRWQGAAESDEERGQADYLFDYMKPFPGARLVLCQSPGADRSNLRERQRNALACVNAVAARAADRGITCSFHPNSPPGSVFRVHEDYQVLLDGLDTRVLGFAPDTGHIAAGGMDAVAVLQAARPLIRHVHFKDVTASGEWATMGAGAVDFPRIVTMLKETGYAGWVMVEEESRAAERDPDAATLQNGRYLQQALEPLLK